MYQMASLLCLLIVRPRSLLYMRRWVQYKPASTYQSSFYLTDVSLDWRHLNTQSTHLFLWYVYEMNIWKVTIMSAWTLKCASIKWHWIEVLTIMPPSHWAFSALVMHSPWKLTTSGGVWKDFTNLWQVIANFLRIVGKRPQYFNACLPFFKKGREVKIL